MELEALLGAPLEMRRALIFPLQRSIDYGVTKLMTESRGLG